MSAAKPNEQPELVREESVLTPAQDKQMQRMDQNGDGVISKKEARAEARFATEQLAKLSFWKMVALGVVALLFLSWIGNACLVAAIVSLSKDLKVEGSALKNTNGDAISTLGQKQVYEVTLVKATRRALGEQGSNATINDTHAHQHSPVVAQVSCANVLLAISSIENGIDGSLVKIDLGSGRVWEPRASAATYELQDNSFGIEQIYLDDQRDESYDVTCEISKADCESAPDSLCDAVSSEVIFSDHDDRRALSFEDTFDGEANRHSRRLSDCFKAGSHWHYKQYHWNYKYRHLCPQPPAAKSVWLACYANSGADRIWGHTMDLSFDQCYARALALGVLRFGMEYPQGYGKPGSAQCLLPNFDQTWKQSHLRFPGLTKVADAECEVETFCPKGHLECEVKPNEREKNLGPQGTQGGPFRLGGAYRLAVYCVDHFTEADTGLLHCS